MSNPAFSGSLHFFLRNIWKDSGSFYHHSLQYQPNFFYTNLPIIRYYYYHFFISPFFVIVFVTTFFVCLFVCLFGLHLHHVLCLFANKFFYRFLLVQKINSKYYSNSCFDWGIISTYKEGKLEYKSTFDFNKEYFLWVL